MSLIAIAPTDPRRAVKQLSVVGSVVTVVLLAVIKLAVIQGVVFAKSGATDSARFKMYVEQGLAPSSALVFADRDLAQTASGAREDIVRSLSLDFFLLWMFWFTVGFFAGANPFSTARGILAACAIGEIVTTIPFVIQNGTLAVTGIHTDSISVQSLARLVGVHLPAWTRNVGPFEAWWAWVFGVAVATTWTARTGVVVMLAIASVVLWKLAPAHWL